MKNILEYKSVAELSAALYNTEPLECWGCSAQKYSNSPSWSGETFDGAFEKLLNGDQKNAAKIKAQGDIIAKGKGKGVPQFELSVRGCLPSVPNYLRGVPKNMLNVRREPRHKPVIDMFIDSGIYDGIDVDKVAAFTARLANVIAAVERAGVRINLYSACIGKNKGDIYGYVVKIKEASSPLNLLNIAFPIMNRAMCRVVFLHWMDCNIDHVIYGHGCVTQGEIVKKEIGRDGVYFSTHEDLNLTLEEIATRVNEYLNKK
jgi:hypothetical protein